MSKHHTLTISYDGDDPADLLAPLVEFLDGWYVTLTDGYGVATDGYFASPSVTLDGQVHLLDDDQQPVSEAVNLSDLTHVHIH